MLDSQTDFADRAEMAMPRRHIRARTVPLGHAAVGGEHRTGVNIAWTSWNRSRTAYRELTYHADKNCYQLPDGALKAYPITDVKGKWGFKPCDHCTVPEQTP